MHIQLEPCFAFPSEESLLSESPHVRPGLKFSNSWCHHSFTDGTTEARRRITGIQSGPHPLWWSQETSVPTEEGFLNPHCHTEVKVPDHLHPSKSDLPAPRDTPTPITLPHILDHFRLPPLACAPEDWNLGDHLGTRSHGRGMPGGDVTNPRSPSRLEVSNKALAPLLPPVPGVACLELPVWASPLPEAMGSMRAVLGPQHSALRRSSTGHCKWVRSLACIWVWSVASVRKLCCG